LSTILKALRRLEQDQAAERERPLQNAVVEGGLPPAAPSTSRLRRLAFALAGVALGAGGVLWLQRGGDEIPPPALPPVASAPPVVPPQAPVAPAPTPAPLPLPVAPPPPVAVVEVEPPPPEAAAEPRVTIAVGAPAEPGAESAAPSSPDPGMEAQAAVAPPEVASAPPTGPIAVAPPADPAPSLESFPAPPREAPPKRVVRAEPRSTAPPSELPVSAESAVAGAVVGGGIVRSGEESALGEDVRPAPQPRRRAARAPASVDVAVVRTVWHPKAERRTALLASPDDAAPREYREGDRVGTLTLLRIEPSGVVFEKDGAEVRQNVGGAP
jgi:hypothetical protein